LERQNLIDRQYPFTMLVITTWAGATTLSLLAIGVVGCCSSQQQQQQITIPGTEEEPKRICPKCGMENNRAATFCGDCGFGFKQSRESSDE